MSRTVEPSRVRLATYLALAAGAAPAAHSAAQVVSRNLNLVLDPTPIAVSPFQRNDSVLHRPILGPDLGGLFEFAASGSQFGSVGATSILGQRASIRFRPTNGWTRAEFISNTNGAPNQFPQRPRRLSSGAAIGQTLATPGQWSSGGSATFTGPLADISFDGNLGYGHSDGNWAFSLGANPSIRGFLGFRVSKDGGASYNYGWFDIEYDRTDPLGLLTIHGVGFNLTTDAQILAGQTGAALPAPGPVGLALLAAGAAGIRRTRARAV
ncbi:MAG: hypothetical protein D6693_00235 [Planctomycetota bacterium]|nr:MAG: hypothetical protein D6693_00235 [Planctomycetota bacterium]